MTKKHILHMLIVIAELIKVIIGVRRSGKSIMLDLIQDELKEKGVFILAADMGGQPAAKIDFDMPCAIVIGAEGSGVSEGVRKAADLIVSIPQKGRIQSLNASNAAAVLLYEALRQRRI